MSVSNVTSMLPLPTVSAKIYGEPFIDLPRDLYIPPDALEGACPWRRSKGAA
jgi:hypothetical protein